MAELGPPGLVSTRAWAWDDLHCMRNLPGLKAWPREADGGGIACGCGSAWRSTPECTRSCGSGHRKECTQGGACAQCQG